MQGAGDLAAVMSLVVEELHYHHPARKGGRVVETGASHDDFLRQPCLGPVATARRQNVILHPLHGLQLIPVGPHHLIERDPFRHDAVEIGQYRAIDQADIPAELIDRIFEPFFTTKGSGSGTGFGLSTSKGIIEAMQGALIVQSTIGQGSTFTIYLPVSSDRPQDLLQEYVSSRSSFAMASRLQSKTLRILHIDDEDANNAMVSRMLESLGHIVTTFEDPDEALRSFEGDPHAYELMITDDSMPRMSGSELSRKILSINPDLPVVVVTGSSRKQIRSRYAPLGITEYVAKPFGVQDISKAIRVASEQSVNKILERL